MKLRDYMQKQGLSQIEVARRSGVTQATISLYLSGHRGLSLGSALKISYALGIPVQELSLQDKDEKAAEAKQ